MTGGDDHTQPDPNSPAQVEGSNGSTPGWLRQHWKAITIGAVAFLVGVGAGAAGGGDTKSKDKTIKLQGSEIRDLSAKNDALQKQVDDRAAQTAADNAHAASVKADQQAAKDKAAADAKAKAEADAKAAAKAQADAAAAAAAEAAKKNTIDADGVYAIGQDINPGQWRTPGGADCYYAILNSTDTSDIATNDLPHGQAIVTLPAGKFFETKRCDTWTHS